jgi:hypothetical protein
MRPAVRDLFGEIPVTLDELLAWMLAVPGIPPTSTRFVYYVRGWRVIDKIRAAKACGTLEEILDPAPAPPPYRLAAAIDEAARSVGGWRNERHAVRARRAA